jgi:glutaconate CoA-transferase subunit B
VRVISLHPGVRFEDVENATGFALIDAVEGETAMPDAEALAIINRMDPHNIRATVITDNPPARSV